MVQPTNGLYEGALYDHVIDAAKLLPADVVLEPTTYWFVSPIELEIRLPPRIQVFDSIQYKEYYLYRVCSYANGHAEFYDTSGNLLACVEWRFNSGNTQSQPRPLTPSLSNYSRVQDAFGGNDSLRSDPVRQYMWNKFTQTDQYKQLMQNNSSTSNQPYGNDITSFDELPEAYKTFLHDDTKTTNRKPKTTTASHQSGIYNAPSYESYLPPSGVPDQSAIYNPLSSFESYDEVFNPKEKEQNLNNSTFANNCITRITSLILLYVGNERRIPFSQIKLGEVIGEGSYGVIYYAEYNNRKHAIKRFKYYEAKKEDALKEAEVLL